MTKSQLEKENKDLKTKQKATQEILNVNKKLLSKAQENQPPSHLACGYEIVKGHRVYGSKVAINAVKDKMQELEEQRKRP